MRLDRKDNSYVWEQINKRYHNRKVKSTQWLATMGEMSVWLIVFEQQADNALASLIVVKEGDTLSLGKHTLAFVEAPMVHWPEVIVTYDTCDKVLFSADGFGKFGALDVEEDWACEARRYYFNICGKYGAQVQLLLKKAANLDIKIICPLHGPILKENLV